MFNLLKQCSISFLKLFSNCSNETKSFLYSPFVLSMKDNIDVSIFESPSKIFSKILAFDSMPKMPTLALPFNSMALFLIYLNKKK